MGWLSSATKTGAVVATTSGLMFVAIGAPTWAWWSVGVTAAVAVVSAWIDLLTAAGDDVPRGRHASGMS